MEKLWLICRLLDFGHTWNKHIHKNVHAFSINELNLKYFEEKNCFFSQRRSSDYVLFSFFSFCSLFFLLWNARNNSIGSIDREKKHLPRIVRIQFEQWNIYSLLVNVFKYTWIDSFRRKNVLLPFGSTSHSISMLQKWKKKLKNYWTSV